MWCIYGIEYHSVIKKEWYFIIYSKMNKTGGHYVEWNKSDTERRIPHVLSHMCMVLKSQLECKIVITRGLGSMKGRGIEEGWMWVQNTEVVGFSVL